MPNNNIYHARLKFKAIQIQNNPFQMDWTRFIEPYFSDISVSIRNAIIQEIVKQLPPTPTLDSQQQIVKELMAELPKMVQDVKLTLCNVVLNTTEPLMPHLTKEDVAGLQMQMLNMFSGKPIQLQQDMSQLLTCGSSLTGILLDTDTVTMECHYDTIYELWKYYRLMDEECIKLYPNNSHLELDITSDQITEFYPIYKQFTRLFSKFINTKTTILTFWGFESKLICIRRTDSQNDQNLPSFEVGQAEILSDDSIKVDTDTPITSVYLVDLGNDPILHFQPGDTVKTPSQSGKTEQPEQQPN